MVCMYWFQENLTPNRKRKSKKEGKKGGGGGTLHSCFRRKGLHIGSYLGFLDQRFLIKGVKERERIMEKKIPKKRKQPAHGFLTREQRKT